MHRAMMKNESRQIYHHNQILIKFEILQSSLKDKCQKLIKKNLSKITLQTL